MSNQPTPSESPDPATEAERDERLAVILEEVMSQAAEGVPLKMEEFIQKYPELADELRELYAMSMVADNLADLSAPEFDFGAQTTSEPNGNQPAPSAKSSAMPDLVGEYEPLAEIGRGGMGVVYKARQKSLGRTVALKMILRGELASDTDLSRFRSEAETTAKLNHPHIVPVYEVGEQNGQPFFSMQYVEGTTLSQRLVDGPLSPHEAARFLLPICRAIAEAHRHGVLHRDLKPSNILIDQDNRPYVTDFGLAKRIITDVAAPANAGGAIQASLTQSGAILGTPGYMAPEQAAGQRGNVGPATDVYSLGAILYATLTGRPPFQAASPVDTVLMVLEQDPVPPRLLNPSADADLELIALKCLQKPDDLRYRDADALADDLECYLSNEPISARSSQFSQIISRAFRETHHAAILENWGLLWMLHAAVLLLLCLITNAMQLSHVTSRLPYLGLWTVGLSLWAVVFWNLRQRSGPVTFVERQIAHVWAGSMAATTFLYVVEWFLGLPVLALSPVLGLVSGMVFLVKAGILSGAFYIQSAALFLTGVAMAVIQYEAARSGFPNLAISLFGFVSAICFFVPGLKYFRQRRSD